jgi:titin
MLTVAFAPPLTVEPAFAPTYYEYALSTNIIDVGTWTTGLPKTNVSPLGISNLSFQGYRVRLRAVNLAGPGAASAAVTGTPKVAPYAPTQLAVTAQAGRVITVRWVPHIAGLRPTSYVLQGGSLPREVQASFPTGSLMPTFTFSAPPGEYYARVHALANDGAWSPASNEIRIFVDVPRPPSAPAQLLAAVNGAEVALSWKNTFEGGPPMGLRLKLAGSTVASLPLGEMFSVANVPPGTHDIALTAVNEWGESPLSNGVRVIVPSSCLVPNAPQYFTATSARGPFAPCGPSLPRISACGTEAGAALHGKTATGQAFDLAWLPPSSGAAVTGYTVEVSGAYNGSFNTTDRTVTGTAPPGSYTVSVRAGNSCGVGPSAPAQTIVIY